SRSGQSGMNRGLAGWETEVSPTDGRFVFVADALEVPAAAPAQTAVAQPAAEEKLTSAQAVAEEKVAVEPAVDEKIAVEPTPADTLASQPNPAEATKNLNEAFKAEMDEWADKAPAVEAPDVAAPAETEKSAVETEPVAQTTEKPTETTIDDE